MPKKADEPRPIYIRWEASLSVEGEDIRIITKRYSGRYLSLAEYLLDHPPNKEPFRPSDLGERAYAVQTYRADVENWVALKMAQAVSEDPEFGDTDLFRQVIRELHNLPWNDGSGWKGFYLIQPMAHRMKRVERWSWSMQAIGKESFPSYSPVFSEKVRGEKVNVMGLWYEPSFENYELWKSYLALTQLRRMAIAYTDAALTGRSIGQLKPAQMLRMLEAALSSAQKALPPPKEDTERSEE